MSRSTEKTKSNSHTLATIKKHRVIPVIKLDKVEQAKPLAQALLAAGLPLAEVTFRSDVAEQALAAMSAVDGMVTGAGTILCIEQVKQAVRAGATFIISPGFDIEVVNYCIDRGIMIMPGIATPSELMQAIKAGVKTVKFFPAEAYGGLKTLKALAAPFPRITFIPTGGISPENIQSYLDFSPVLACGGSWMVKPELIAAGNYAEITRLSSEALALTQVSS